MMPARRPGSFLSISLMRICSPPAGDPGVRSCPGRMVIPTSWISASALAGGLSAPRTMKKPTVPSDPAASASAAIAPLRWRALRSLGARFMPWIVQGPGPPHQALGLDQVLHRLADSPVPAGRRGGVRRGLPNQRVRIRYGHGVADAPEDAQVGPIIPEVGDRLGRLPQLRAQLVQRCGFVGGSLDAVLNAQLREAVLEGAPRAAGNDGHVEPELLPKVQAEP